MVHASEEDRQAIREAIRKICAAFPDAYWRDVDKAGAYPQAFVDALTASGYLATLIPEEYGGAGLGITEAGIILEEINRSPGNGLACHAQMYTMGTLLRHGSDEQKRRYLPKIAGGELRLQAFAVTEPDAGSETTRLQTRAVRRGDKYVVNGQKIFISRAKQSDLMLLLARTTPYEELKDKGYLDTTLIIITAKHGQSPIDTHRFQEVGKGITTTPADVIAGFLPPVPSPENPNTPDKTLPDGTKLSAIGPTQDDISLLWLAPGASVTGAVGALEASGTAGIGLGQIFYGASLEPMFNAPGLPPNGDPRTPDIIVQPNVGVIYTTSGKKQAEHGGFAQDDTNVMILVSNPSFKASTVTTFVETTQVAPTVLEALGLDPSSLDAVQKEGTPVLPGLNFKQE